MPFTSIDQLLQTILAQPQWEKQRRFDELVKCWFQVIDNPKVAQNTRPYCLRDDTLIINTSSSVWSQHLSLQRYTLLKKINVRISQPIQDLYFFSAKWIPYTPVTEQQADTSNIHPSLIEINNNYTKNKPEQPLIKSDTPEETIKQWFINLQKNAELLPLCPQCQASTPEGELERWGICACCFAQKKS